MIMAGPFLTGYTQTLNDWYDREIDAINEPNRPIPSGAISEQDVSWDPETLNATSTIVFKRLTLIHALRLLRGRKKKKEGRMWLAVPRTCDWRF